MEAENQASEKQLQSPNWWTKGMPSPNPLGRPSVGRTVAETFRTFLAAKDKDDKTVKSRLNKQMQVLYEISVDKDHKQCVQAAIYCQTRAYGDIPKEVGQSVLAASLLQALPEEHKAFIAQLAFGDNNMLLADGVIEDTEQEGNSMEQE